MKYWISWRQWQTWTEGDELADEHELMMSMRGLADHRKVVEFIELFKALIERKLFEEVTQNMHNPRRDQRSYPEALYELSRVLNTLLSRGKQ